MYDKSTDSIFLGTVKSSSVRPDYYHVAKSSGGTEGGLEQELFQRFESVAAPLLSALLALPHGVLPLNPMARFDLANYIAIQRARVPAMVERAEETAVFQMLALNDRLLSDPAAFAARAAEVNLAPHEGETLEDLRVEWLALFRNGELEIRPPKGYALVHVLDIVMKTLPQAFFEMDWDIREAKAEPGLLLGDEPVVAVMPDGLASDQAKGFRTPGVEIVMPLSPARLLVLHGRRTAEVVTVAAPPRSADSHDWVRRANLATWQSAARYVWGHEKSDLETIRDSLTAVERKDVRQVEVQNLPSEWKGYLQPGMKAADRT